MSNDATDLLVGPLESQQPAAQGFDLVLLDLAAFCNDAEILSWAATSSTTITVTFAQAVIDNVALRHADAYVLQEESNGALVPAGHAPRVLSVRPVEPTPSAQALLTTEEMRQGLSYRLTIHYLESA